MKNLDETLDGLRAVRITTQTAFQELDPAYKNVIWMHEGLEKLFEEMNERESFQNFEDTLASIKHIVYKDLLDMDQFVGEKINILEAYLEL